MLAFTFSYQNVGIISFNLLAKIKQRQMCFSESSGPRPAESTYIWTWLSGHMHALIPNSVLITLIIVLNRPAISCSLSSLQTSVYPLFMLLFSLWRSLPEPLMTYGLYKEFISLASKLVFLVCPLFLTEQNCSSFFSVQLKFMLDTIICT